MGDFSVIIPAHNEASVIGQTLLHLLAGVAPGEAPEVIIVCNGCSDNTAEVAAGAAPEAAILELSAGSKALALNAGLAAATAAPVIIVDADIEVSHAALAALAGTLREPGVMAASPAARIDSTACDPWVRAYYRVWEKHSYRREGVGGSGVYGISAEGANQLGWFPPIIADDSFVRTRFPPEQQRRLKTDGAGRPVFAIVRPARTLKTLIASEARWRSGDAQLRSLGMPFRPLELGKGEEAIVLWRNGASPRDLTVYYGVKMAGRLLLIFNRLTGRAGRWFRDPSRG